MSVPTLPIHIDPGTSSASLTALRNQVLDLGRTIEGLNTSLASKQFASPLDTFRAQMAADVRAIKEQLTTGLASAVGLGGQAGVSAGTTQVLNALKETTEKIKIAVQSGQEAIAASSVRTVGKVKLTDVDADTEVAKIKSAAAQVQVAMRTAAAESRALSALSSGNVVNKRNLPLGYRSELDQLAAESAAQARALADDLAGYRAMLALKAAAQRKAEADDLAGYRAMLALKVAAQNRAEADDLAGYRAMLALKVAAQNKAEAESLASARAAAALARVAQSKAEADDIAGHRAMLALRAAAQNKALADDIAGYRQMLVLKVAAQNKAAAEELAAVKALQAAKAASEARAGAGGPQWRKLTLDMNDAHAAARGLAGGFGQLWLTYGSVVPLVAGAALAASFVKSLQTGAQFVESLYVIQELAGNTGAEVRNLANAALDLGRTSQYGPVEVAKGMEILALAGLKASEVLAAIKPTLNFASAGGVSTEKAAETLVAVGTAYGYTAAQFAVVGDIIAKSAADSMASVDSMSEAFKSSSVVAQQYGVTLQDMSQNLMFLAQIGIKGTAAGTSVRNMYSELAKGSGKVAAALAQMGVEAQDGNGKMRPLMETMEQMVLATANLSGKSANTFFQTISNERGGKDLAAIYAGVYKVINDNEAKRLASSAAGTKSVYETVDALTAQGRVTEANALKVETLKAGFAQMKADQEAMASSTAGFAFFADLEKQLTPLTQYKGILASLQTDFVQAFTGAEASVDGSHKAINGAQDALYLLGVQLKTVADSEGFRQAIASMVSGLASFLSTVVDVGRWLSEHQRLLASVALFYVAYRVAVAAAAVQTAVFAAAQTGLASIMAGTLASTLAGSIVSLYATAEAYAAARGAALAFQLTVLTFGVAAVAAGAYALYLGAKYLFLAESAEEAAERTKAADLANLQESTKANAARIEQTLEAVKADNDKFARLEELRAQGITGEIATVKVAGEAAMARIEFNQLESESLAKRTLEQRQANLAIAQGAVDKATEYGRFVPYVGAPLVAAAALAQNVLIAQGKAALADYEASVGKVRMGAAVALQQTAAAFAQKTTDAKLEQERADAAAKAAGRRFTGEDEFVGGKEGKGAKERDFRAQYDRMLSLSNEYYRDHKRTLDEGYKQEQEVIKGMVASRQITEAAGYAKSLTATVAYEAKQTELIELTYANRMAKLQEIDDAFSGSAAAYDKFLTQQLDEEEKAANQYKESNDQLKQLVATRKITSTNQLAKSLSDDSEAFKKAFTSLEVYNKGLELKAQADREAAGLSASAREGYEARAAYLAKFGKEEEQLTAILKDQQAQAQSLAVAMVDVKLAGNIEALPELKGQFEAVSLAIASSTDKLAAFKTKLAAGSEQAGRDAEQKALIKEFDETNGKLKDGITKALFDGSKDGVSGLKTELKKAVFEFSKQKFRIVIDAFLNPVTSALTSFMNPAAGAAASAGGSLNGLSGLSNLLPSGFTSSIGSTLANVLPSSFSSALGLSSTASMASNAALIGGGSSATAAATAAGAAGNASLFSGISAAVGAIPVWGQIALGVGALAAAIGLFGDDGPQSKGTGNAAVNYDRFGNRTSTSYQDGAGGSSAAADATLAAMSKGYLDAAKGLGLEAKASFFAIGGHGTEGENDQKFRISGGTNTSKAYFDSDVQASTPEAIKLAASRAVFAALAGSDLPRQLAGLFDGQDFNTVTQEGIDSVLKKGQALQAFDLAINLLPLENLAQLSYTAANGLAAAAGGVENLGNLATQAASYANNYLTTEERRQQTIKNINAQTEAYGFDAATGTRATFRALMEAQDANTESGQRAIVALLGVEAAFASITPELDAAGAAVASLSDAMKSLLEVRDKQAIELMRAQGDTAGADAAQYKIDTSGYNAAEIALFDYNAAIRKQIDILLAAAEAAKAVASERAGLQDQLDGFVMSNVELLAKQRAALDESNRALFDQVQAAKVTSEAAAKAASERADLQTQYNSLTMTSAQLLALQRAALDESNRALFDQVEGLKAEAAEQERLKKVASDRAGIEIQIMELSGDAAGALAAKRAIELAALDASLQPLQLVVYGLQDMATAAAAAAAAAQAAGAAYFAQIDRDKNVASNVATSQSALDKFFGTAASGGDAALIAANATLAAAKTAAANWRNVAETIRSTLEGLQAGTAQLSGNAYEATFAQFKTLTTLARGGDAASAGKLSGAANAFLTASESNSATLADYLRDRSRVENSLAETLQSVDASASIQEQIANSSEAAVAQLTAMNASLTGFAADVYAFLQSGYQGATRPEADSAVGRYSTAAADYSNYFATTTAGASREFAGGTLTRLGGDMAQFTSAGGQVDYIRAGESLLDVGKRIAAFRTQWENQYAVNLPSYDIGTNYVPRDTYARIHEGEAIIPKAYNPAAGGGAQNTARLDKLVAQLMEKIEVMTIKLGEGNINTKAAASALNGELTGRPMIVEVVGKLS